MYLILHYVIQGNIYIWLPLIKMHKSKRFLFYYLPLSIMEINSKMLTDNLICLLYKISKIQMTRRKRGGGVGGEWSHLALRQD